MRDLLPEIIEAVSVPVIGAGGVIDGADIAEVLAMGAAGVQMGTRFAATVESSAPEAFKQMYVDATTDQVVLIKSPVGLPGRALKNPFWERTQRADYPRIKKCANCLKECHKEYCIMDELLMTAHGDVDQGLVFSGSEVVRIHDVPAVADLMARLETEYSEAEGEHA
jgi:NAD(P)H-dependent flavin oxidoreductase YrpB (nitropropane dioxygenase family)